MPSADAGPPAPRGALPSSPPSSTLVGDVLRVATAPLRHGSLVLLGDEEAAAAPSVVGTVHVGDETRRRGDALRLLTREDVPEVHLRPGPVQAPRRRVVHAGRLVRAPERPEAEPVRISAEYQPLGHSRMPR